MLDEADEMLSRGFKDQIHDVFRTLGTEVQVSSIVNMLILIVFKVMGFVPRWNNLITWSIILCVWGGGGLLVVSELIVQSFSNKSGVETAPTVVFFDTLLI